MKNLKRHLQHLSSNSNIGTTISCPSSGTLPVNSGETVRIAFSPPGKLCTLTQRHSDGTGIIPISRSYDNNPWEAVSGPYKALAYDCNEMSCQMTIPEANDPSKIFLLTSHKNRRISKRDEAARFFEQATFGITTADLMKVENEVKGSDLLSYFVQWTYDQMYNKKPTSHRSYWRQRTFPVYKKTGREGKAIQPCEKGSFWRGYAFNEFDNEKMLKVDLIDGNYALSINGSFRTIVNSFELKGSEGWSTNSFPMTFNICWVKSFIGGPVSIYFDGKCRMLRGGNPLVIVDGMKPKVAKMLGKTIEKAIMNGIHIEKMTLESIHKNQHCVSTKDSIFVEVQNGESIQTLLFEPRLMLRENLRMKPLNDGGKRIMNEIGGEDALCSNVPRTFLNEDNCQLATDVDACAPLEFVEGSVQLNTDNLKLFFEEKWRYVYAVTQLRLEDDDKSPCQHGTRSRWKKYPSRICNQNIRRHTASIFERMILQSDDPNPHIKDVYLPMDENCHNKDLSIVRMEIMIDSDCWMNVHPDHLNVYDFSDWTEKHPGSINKFKPIKQFAIDGKSHLSYPLSHSMMQWENTKKNLSYLGRLGDKVDFKDFPDSLRSNQIADIFGLVVPTTASGIKAVICGSPFETKSVFSYSSFSIDRHPDLNILNPKELSQQKRTVWLMIAMSASDQLRQRIAW